MAAPTREPANVPTPATLALDAFPWGRIVSVREPATGQRIAAMEGLVTPRRLSLPPGRWEVAIASGVGSEVRTLTVDLAPGSTAWAWRAHRAGAPRFGLPSDVDPLEGWIVTA